jgi:hypothetical protein
MDWIDRLVIRHIQGQLTKEFPAMKSFWAKAAGWAQFALTAAPALFGHGLPHGFDGWIRFAASALTAVAVHHAASTDGAK